MSGEGGKNGSTGENSNNGENGACDHLNRVEECEKQKRQQKRHQKRRRIETSRVGMCRDVLCDVTLCFDSELRVKPSTDPSSSLESMVGLSLSFPFSFIEKILSERET